MNNYRRTKTTVSLINYHFVFCPRYRRKIFLNERLNSRFKELVNEIANNNEFKELKAMPNLWTRSYFVSTAGNVSSETVKQYVENQRKR